MGKTSSSQVRHHETGLVPARFQFATLAVANAACVAALQCNQAISRNLAASFPEQDMLSIVPTVTLVGYAVGVGLIAFGPVTWGRAPLQRHLGFLAFGLAAAGLAPDVFNLAAASLMVGVGAAAAPRLLAKAAQLVGPCAAGGAIGRVISGSLVAVLCIRLLGESVACIAGWRWLFLSLAAIVGGLVVLARRIDTPQTVQGATSPAGDGFITLWRSYPLLRRVAAQQAALFAAYNASWMTVLLDVPMQERWTVVLCASCAGIVSAFVAGRLADRNRQGRMATAGAVAVLIGAGLLWPAASDSGPLARALLLPLGMSLVDAGLQIALVANQTRAQALMPGARGRLAATLTVSGFLGGAFAAGAAFWLWHALGWHLAMLLAGVGGCIGVSCSFLAVGPRPVEHRPAAGQPSGLETDIGPAVHSSVVCATRLGRAGGGPAHTSAEKYGPALPFNSAAIDLSRNARGGQSARHDAGYPRNSPRGCLS